MTEQSSVWVVEVDCYSSMFVAGVFASIEAVIDAFPVTAEMLERRSRQMGDRGYTQSAAGWQKHGDDSWSNGCDMSDAVSAARMEVQGLPAPPTRP